MKLPRLAASLFLPALLLLPSTLLAADVTPARAEPRRDRLGHELPAGGLARMGSTGLHDDAPIVFTPDGTTLIAASYWSVGFWDVATGKELRRVAAPLGGLGRQLALAPDGKTVACGGGYPDHVVLLLDVATGKELARIPHGREVTDAAFAAGGKLLLTAPPSSYLAGQENWVRAHQVPAGKEAWKIAGLGFALLADGKTVVVVKPPQAPGGKNSLQLHDVLTGKQKKSFTLEAAGWCHRVVASPDGKLLALADEGNIQVHLWDLAAEKVVRVIPQAGDPLAFSPDGKALSYAAIPNGIRGPVDMHLVDVASGQEILPLGKGVCPVGFTADGKTLVAPGKGGEALALWDRGTGKERPLLPAGDLSPQALSRWTGGHQGLTTFSPDGKTLATSAWCAGSKFADGGVRRVQVWDVATGKERLPRIGHQARITHAAFEPSGKVVFSAARDQTFRWWEAATGKEVRRLDVPRAAAAVSPDGKTAASLEASRLLLWDAATGKEVRHWDAPMPADVNRGFAVQQVAFAPDGRTVAWGGQDNTIRLLDVVTGKELHALRGHERVGSGPRTFDPYRLGIVDLSFAPDGKTLVSYGVDGSHRLWDVARGTARWVFRSGAAERTRRQSESHMQTFWAQGGGSVLLVDVEHKGVRVVETATGKERGRYPLHGLVIRGVALSPDGKTLAYGSFAEQSFGHAKEGNYPIILVDATEGKEVRRLAGHRLPATALAFSPDGRSLVSGSEDATLLVWDLTGPKEE